MFDLEWGGGVKYREVRLQEEIEQSKYAFGQVDMPPRRVLGAAPGPVRQELRVRAERCSTRASMLPALEHALKCSHLFNILDSSGSIGVTERTAYILRVRQLAVRIAQGPGREGHRCGREPRGGGRVKDMDRELLDRDSACEEIPASWLPGPDARRWRRTSTRASGSSASAGEAPAEVVQHAAPAGGPRGPVVGAPDATSRKLVMGPPVSAAYQADGGATPAGRGLRARSSASTSARSSGWRRPRASTSRITVHHRGKATMDVLADVMTGLLRDMTFPKQMRWDAHLDDGKGELVFGARSAG